MAEVLAAIDTRDELAFVISLRLSRSRLGFWNRFPVAHTRMWCIAGTTTTARCGLLRRRTFTVGDSHRHRCACKAGDNLYGRQSQYRECSEPFVHLLSDYHSKYMSGAIGIYFRSWGNAA